MALMLARFEWSGSAWQIGGNEVFGEGAWEGFGRLVSLSADGSRLAVGAPWHYAVATETENVG